MKGFKNTTKLVTGHHNVPAHQFHTFGKSNPGHRLAVGGPVPNARDQVHGLHEKGNVRDMHPYGEDHAAVLRKVPATALEEEHGGKGPLTPGYSHGGKAEKHFHVHHHHHAAGGKTHSTHKHYAQGGKLKKMEMQAEAEAHTEKRDELRTGLAKGGAATRNRLAKGGFGHIKKGALHKDMGVPKGKKIPMGALNKKLAHDKATHNTKGIKRDVFAKNAKEGKFGHAKGGHIHNFTSPVAPDYKTGGTVNKLGAGGALYKRGGKCE